MRRLLFALLNLGVGYCWAWWRAEDPFVRRDATLHALMRDQPPVAACVTVYGGVLTRASGSNACISTDMSASDDFDGCSQ
jgi:hypothetical protein